MKLNKYTRGALLATGLTLSAFGTKVSLEAMLDSQAMEAVDDTIAYGLEIDQQENPGITNYEIQYFRDSQEYHRHQKQAAIVGFMGCIILGSSIFIQSSTAKVRRRLIEIDDTLVAEITAINSSNTNLQTHLHGAYTEFAQQVLDGSMSAEDAEFKLLELAAKDFTFDLDENS
ncbi:hypothetical protein KBD20_01815 [Candidatus Saccharibacteria bacterium]|nr:hypothetical protein [Candidatus Saccharibacteria bacterium]